MVRESRRTRNSEIATIGNNHLLYGGYAYGGNTRIQPKDSILIDRGHTRGYEVLRDILRDPHTFAVCQKRWLSVVEREWEIQPASESRKDKRVADFVKNKLKAIASFSEQLDGGELIPNIYGGFDQICYNLLKGELYGFSVAEILWGSNGQEVYISQVKDKSPGRFVYLAGTKGYRFRLLTNEHPTSGIKLPANKFVIHTFHPEDDNPYGWGMGGRLFYPVMFKRRLAEFALVYADKFGSPTGKAVYPNGREDLKDVLLEAMDNMGQESGIALPKNCEFEWLSIATGGGDVYTSLMDYFDREISKTVLGETGSTDQQGSGGSRARDQVGNEVRIEITKASSDFLSATLNRSLIAPLVRYNFGNKVAIPGVWRKFPELESKEDLNGRATRDNTISTMMGLKPTRKYVEETYSIELEEKSEDEQKQQGFNSELANIFGNDSGQDTAEETSEETTPGNEPKDTLGDFSEPYDYAQVKKILKWNGLEIGVEYFPGDRRHNKILKSGYGHIRNTVGADGMALDVYFHSNVLNPDVQTSDKLYKITQLDKNGNFDEHKYMVGFKSKNTAKQAYLKQMPKAMFGGIKKVAIASMDEYRKPRSAFGGQRTLRPHVASHPKRDRAKTDTDSFISQSVKAALPEVDKWRSQINDEVQRINNLDTDDRSKFSQLESSLFRLYEEMDENKYADILGSAIAAAEFNGRYDVSKSSKL